MARAGFESRPRSLSGLPATRQGADL